MNAPLSFRPLRNLLAALVTFVAAASGCQCDDSLGRLDGNIVIEPESFDFGKVAIGAEKLLPLALKNRGSFRLELRALEANAPFFAPAGTATIATGVRLERQISFRPTALGLVEGTLTVVTDDPDAPTISLPLIGEGIEAAVRVEPLAIDFGEVLWDAATRAEPRTISVSNPGSDAFELTSIELVEDGGGAFTLDRAGAVARYEPGASKSFSVTYLPKSMGTVTGRLRLLTSASAAPEVLVTLLARAVGPVLEVCAGTSGGVELCTQRGEAPRIDFGLVELGQTGRGAIRVQNAGDRPLRAQVQPLGQVSRFVFSPDPTMFGAFMVEPGGEQRFDVNWTPTDYQFDSINVSVGSNSAVRRSAVVRLDGSVPRAVVHVVPRTLTFTLDGRVERTSARLKLQSCGQRPLLLTADVRIVQTQGAANAFSLDAAPRAGQSLLPGECTPDGPGLEFDVVFAPSADGVYRATVELETNDPSEPQLLVSVQGDKRS